VPAPLAASYWTGVWEPAFEAHSREVETLRAALAPRASVVSASTGQRTRLLPRRGVWRLDIRRRGLLEVLSRGLERRARLSHVFGALSHWHFLRVLGRRPLLFTVTMPGAPADPRLFRKVAIFAAETEDLAARVEAAGVPPQRVRVVPPGVDLERFRPAAAGRRGGRFRVVFASSPADARELGARGVDLLVELARRTPDLEVVLAWRPWGDLAAARRALAALRPPANVVLRVGAAAEMAEVYRDADAVACCYASGVGKSAPLSVVEGLACGLPALITSTVGLSASIGAAGAGVVVAPELAAVVGGCARLRAEAAAMGEAARRLAVERFGREAFVAAYRELYREIGSSPPASMRRPNPR
jgi:glycosyltransferase involved in cell wall biosynthesis